MAVAEDRSASVFVRKASGLVKAASPLDIFIYNTNNQNIGIGIMFLLMFVPSFYVGANLGWSLFICMLLTLPFATVYALMAIIMPRSGGDYVYNSRVFGPLWGFVSGVNWVFWMIIYIGVPAGYLGVYGVRPLSRFLAITTGNPFLEGLSNFMATEWGILVVGTLLIGWFTFVFVRGMKFYMRFQFFNFLIGLGCLVLILGIVFATGGSFKSRFDDYILKAGGPPDAYNVVTQVAAQTDVEPGVAYSFGGYNWTWTAWAMVQVFYIIGYSITSSFLSGEIKNVRQAQILGMPVSVIFTTIMMGLLVFAFLSKIGYAWLGSLGWVGELDPGAIGLTFTPTFAELAAVMTGSALLGILAVVSFMFWTYVWLPINFLASSRALLAWSFDRLLPASVADVNPRTHTPTRAIIIIAILGEISLLLYAFHVIDSIVGIFGWVLSFCLTCLAAVVLPYKLRDLFEASGVNWRIGGIPVLSILGAVGFACLAYIEYLLWFVPDPAVGVAYVTYPIFGTQIPGWVPHLGVPVLAAIAYLIIRQVQKARGLDVTAAFKEIPPE